MDYLILENPSPREGGGAGEGGAGETVGGSKKPRDPKLGKYGKNRFSPKSSSDHSAAVCLPF